MRDQRILRSRSVPARRRAGAHDDARTAQAHEQVVGNDMPLAEDAYAAGVVHHHIALESSIVAGAQGERTEQAVRGHVVADDVARRLVRNDFAVAPGMVEEAILDCAARHGFRPAPAQLEVLLPVARVSIDVPKDVVVELVVDSGAWPFVHAKPHAHGLAAGEKAVVHAATVAVSRNAHDVGIGVLRIAATEELALRHAQVLPVAQVQHVRRACLLEAEALEHDVLALQTDVGPPAKHHAAGRFGPNDDRLARGSRRVDHRVRPADVDSIFHHQFVARLQRLGAFVELVNRVDRASMVEVGRKASRNGIGRSADLHVVHALWHAHLEQIRPGVQHGQRPRIEQHLSNAGMVERHWPASCRDATARVPEVHP